MKHDQRISIVSARMILSAVTLLAFTAVQPFIGLSAGSDETMTRSGEQVSECTPTPPDAMGPFYKRNAPERNSVGEGHVLSGTVKSAKNCAPVAQARIELWMTGPDGNYSDEYRATVFSSESGGYRFESHLPPGYSGRPPHIHMRVTADGFKPLVTQYYPPRGSDSGNFDLVLIPK